jgi:natural product precursor
MKIAKLELPRLSKADLDERKMNLLRGGELTALQLIQAAWAATPGGTCSNWCSSIDPDGNPFWYGDIYYDGQWVGMAEIGEDYNGDAIWIGWTKNY